MAGEAARSRTVGAPARFATLLGGSGWMFKQMGGQGREMLCGLDDRLVGPKVFVGSRRLWRIVMRCRIVGDDLEMSCAACAP